MFERAQAADRVVGRIRARPLPVSLRETLGILIDELERIGVDLRFGPSLEDAKWLVVSAIRAAECEVPPIHIVARRDCLVGRPSDAAIPSPAQGAALRPMTILLVEDSFTFARATMRALRDGGVEHRLTWVTRGDEAMAFLRRRGAFARAPRPDLILLDLGLPGKDGREVLDEIEADFDLRTIPVVILTASTDEEDRIVSRLKGVKGYLTKPVNMSEFLRLVRALGAAWSDDVILPA